MNILVAGATGLVGSRLVDRLRSLDHGVRPATRSAGIDLATGDGVDRAMEGVDVVVDVLNTDRMDEEGAVAFFGATTRTLLTAEQAHGVRRHVALSIVGIDDLPENGYYRGKVEQERLIRAGSVPFTIVRATQFQEFVATMADWYTVDGVVRLPSTLIRPVAVDEVVDVLVRASTSSDPSSTTREVAGSTALPLFQAVRDVLLAAGDPRPVLRDESVVAFGAHTPDALVPHGSYETSGTTWGAYLQSL